MKMTSKWLVSYTYQHEIGKRIFKNEIINFEDDNRDFSYTLNLYNLTEVELNFIKNMLGNKNDVPDNAIMIIFFSRLID